MNNFGKLKDKILKRLTESYSNSDKGEIKKILNLMKKDKEFKELYLFYEGIENLELTYPGSAELYVESIEKILPEKSELIKETYEKINKLVLNVEVDSNDLYESIDVLTEKTSLNNIDKKVLAKRKLISYLSTEKSDKKITESKVYSENEKLLMSVLSNNFNVLYSNILNESDKEKLKEILSISNDELTNKVNELKETIFESVEKLLTESNDDDLITKLSSVKNEVKTMDVNKYNYYRMLQLKDGLI
jgi:hypothetical protein